MLSLSDIQDFTGALDEEALVDKVYPEMVPGRTAHIDADFLAYMASYEREGEQRNLEDILHATDVMIEDKRKECGAEFAKLHLTPNTSNKGGRYDVAIQKPYQGQRSSDEKPRYLEATRSYMADLRGKVEGVSWEIAEADDGMSMYAWQHWAGGNPELCVIATKDKDLRMCPGLHLDWDTGIIEGAEDTFGFIEMTERVKVSADGKQTTVKKAKGYGTKFFWLQLLMGDTADNIKGCPNIPSSVKNRFAPTAKYRDADDEAKARMDRDPKRHLCGQVVAFAILDDASTDRECLERVMDCYRDLKVRHWETDDAVTWQEVFWSEAKMLWMQRNPGDIDDVKRWVSEACRKED